ncbi:MAG: NAD(P)/FAD-dependent oxidoreductase [Hyphomicrobiaceae bacterium]
MPEISRRQFVLTAGAAGTAAAASTAFAPFAIAQDAAKIVIVGGGAGGATIAHILKKDEPKLDVTLIEANPSYTTCFFSNLYLGGFRTFRSLQHTYDGLRKLGVKVVLDMATGADTDKKIVQTRGGRSFPYDRLVLAPGIDIKYDAIEGYTEAAANIMPHAWKPGPQTQLLKNQLDAMRAGGTVVLAVTPPNPAYRCPPGPYERACMIAHHLKTRKPRSKLIILDAKKTFSKQAVFTEAFGKYYKDIIDLKLTTELDDFGVVKADARTRTVTCKNGQSFKGDVVNIVPHQRAGEIAHKAGCVDGDWCPIDPENFASKKVKDVYVLGDASVAAPMPKSGFSANSQAKVVAADILTALAKKDKFPARYRNTCWSMVAPNDSVKVGGNYAPKEGKLAESDGFVSKSGEDATLRKTTYEESLGWYSGIVADIFAKTTPAEGKKKKV